MPPKDPDDRVSRTPLGSKSPPPLPGTPAPIESLPSLARGGESAGGGLSSLAQSAREKQLKNARWTLIIVGGLTIIANIVAIFMLQGELDTELRKGGFNRANLPAEVQAAIFIDYAIIGSFIVLGLVFIVLGVLVPSYPVPCTITGLVLYILGWIASVARDPRQAGAGLIVKIIIIVALVKAVQAALAYNRESAATAAEFD